MIPKRLSRFGQVSAITAIIVMITGCYGDIKDYCEEMVDCQDGNDADEEMVGQNDLQTAGTKHLEGSDRSRSRVLCRLR